MPKHKRYSGKEIIEKLEFHGFRQFRQKGSHIVLKKITTEGEIGCVVPLHKEIAEGTLHAILNQAKINLNDF